MAQTKAQLVDISTAGISAGSASAPGITFTGDTNTGIYSPGADQVAISTNGSGRLFVDSSGRVLAGTPTARSNFYNTTTVAPRFQLEGSLDTDSRVTSQTYGAASAGGPIYIFAKHRSNSIGGNTVVQSGDYLGEISFQGNDGTEFVEAVTIRAEIDATPGANDMPGRLIFATTKDGQTSPTEAMRIDSQQRVGIGTTTVNAKLQVTESASSALINSDADGIFIENNGNTGITLGSSTTGNGSIRFADSGSANAGLIFYDHTNNFLRIDTNDSERLRIDSAGRLLVGTSTSRSFNTHAGALQIDGDTYSESTVAIVSNSNASEGAYLFFVKQRSGSAGGSTVVQNNDVIGEIRFNSGDGTDCESLSGQIQCLVDGTPGSNDVPGRLVFSVTQDGSASPSERWRLTNDGLSWFLAESGGCIFQSKAAAGTTVSVINVRHSATAITGTGTDSFRVYTNGNVQNTNNSYGSLSDIKLKENIVDASSQWEDLKALQVRKYNFKEETGQETHTQIGLIAQEVELISPGLVSESPDRDAEGNDLGTTTKSVNYSVLYMKAVKALQEAMERIETLEAKVAALEAA